MTGLRSNARRFCLRHGEKVLVGLAAVTCLHTLFVTHWQGYPRDPQQVRSTIAAASAKLLDSPWPAEERADFALADGTAVADLVQQRLRAPIDLGAYVSSQTLYHRLGAEQRPLTEPVLYPVLELLASSERVLLPELRQLPVAPVEDLELQPTPELIPDEFLHQQRRAAVRARPGASPQRRGTQAARTQSAVAAPRAEGRGYPYVAVRGCIDLPQQVRAYMDAIHASFARSELAFEIIDFELERQRQLSGSTWTGWQPVDRDVYFEVLRRTGQRAQDVVSVDATDSAITAPLPARITGVWNKQSTHPRLADYDLTSEELAQELRYLQALSKRAAAKQPQSPFAKRGFADLVQDSYRLRQSVFGASASAPESQLRTGFGGMPVRPGSRVDQIVQDLTRELDPQQLDPQLMSWIRARATAQRRMLLFRYLDFDVVPGETYRYRVRLEVRNPNYRRSLGHAASATVVEGATRFTPWSEPTAAVDVEPLAKYFVTDLAPARRRAGVEARMQVYQYDVETGSTIEQTFRINCGQTIGGSARTTRPNPVKGLIEEGIYAFRTAYRLVDGIADVELALADHPDLQLPADSRGRAFLPNVIVVAGKRPELQVLDSVTQSDDFLQQQTRMEWQATQFESLVRPDGRLDDIDDNPRDFDL